MERPGFDVALVLFDTLWVSLDALLTQNLSGDFFLLYFLIILVAVTGESLGVIAFGAIIIGVTYTGVLALASPSSLLATPTYLLRIPFLFVVALFYGHLVAGTRQERHRADEAKQREELKTDLISMTSHDVRNSLNVILGYAEMLPEVGGLSPEQEDIVRRLEMGTQTVLSLVSNSLDLSRIEAGNPTLVKKPLVLNELLCRVGQQYEAEAWRRHITLALCLQQQQLWVEADPLALERIFANLVHNALKFTPQLGRVTISSTRQNSEVVATVADTGSGIAPEEVPTLFEKYRQAATSRSREGMGLGLFIAKTLVEAHGGRIEVESTPGCGTCFSVFLPMASAGKERGSEWTSPH